MSTPWTVYFLGWYEENQFSSPTWDSSYDENAQNNCGPTCVSEIIMYRKGYFVPPDTIKDRSRLGQNGIGIFYNTDIVTALSQYGITSGTGTPVGKVDFLNAIFYKIRYGKPVVVLRHYVDPNGIITNISHWVVVIGMTGVDYTAQTVTYSDSVYGKEFTETVDQFYNRAWKISDTPDECLLVAVTG